MSSSISSSSPTPPEPRALSSSSSSSTPPIPTVHRRLPPPPTPPRPSQAVGSMNSSDGSPRSITLLSSIPDFRDVSSPEVSPPSTPSPVSKVSNVSAAVRRRAVISPPPLTKWQIFLIGIGWTSEDKIREGQKTNAALAHLKEVAKEIRGLASGGIVKLSEPDQRALIHLADDYEYAAEQLQLQQKNPLKKLFARIKKTPGKQAKRILSYAQLEIRTKLFLKSSQGTDIEKLSPRITRVDDKGVIVVDDIGDKLKLSDLFVDPNQYLEHLKGLEASNQIPFVLNSRGLAVDIYQNVAAAQKAKKEGDMPLAFKCLAQANGDYNIIRARQVALNDKAKKSKKPQDRELAQLHEKQIYLPLKEALEELHLIRSKEPKFLLSPHASNPFNLSKSQQQLLDNLKKAKTPDAIKDAYGNVGDLGKLLDTMCLAAIAEFETPKALERFGDIFALESQLQKAPGVLSEAVKLQIEQIRKLYTSKYEAVAEVGYRLKQVDILIKDFNRISKQGNSKPICAVQLELNRVSLEALKFQIMQKPAAPMEKNEFAINQVALKQIDRALVQIRQVSYVEYLELNSEEAALVDIDDMQLKAMTATSENAVLYQGYIQKMAVAIDQGFDTHLDTLVDRLKKHNPALLEKIIAHQAEPGINNNISRILERVQQRKAIQLTPNAFKPYLDRNYSFNKDSLATLSEQILQHSQAQNMGPVIEFVVAHGNNPPETTLLTALRTDPEVNRVINQALNFHRMRQVDILTKANNDFNDALALPGDAGFDSAFKVINDLLSEAGKQDLKTPIGMAEYDRIMNHVAKLKGRLMSRPTDEQQKILANFPQAIQQISFEKAIAGIVSFKGAGDRNAVAAAQQYAKEQLEALNKQLSDFDAIRTHLTDEQSQQLRELNQKLAKHMESYDQAVQNKIAPLDKTQMSLLEKLKTAAGYANISEEEAEQLPKIFQQLALRVENYVSPVRRQNAAYQFRILQGRFELISSSKPPINFDQLLAAPLRNAPSIITPPDRLLLQDINASTSDQLINQDLISLGISRQLTGHVEEELSRKMLAIPPSAYRRLFLQRLDAELQKPAPTSSNVARQLILLRNLHPDIFVDIILNSLVRKYCEKLNNQIPEVALLNVYIQLDRAVVNHLPGYLSPLLKKAGDLIDQLKSGSKGVLEIAQNEYARVVNQFGLLQFTPRQQELLKGLSEHPPVLKPTTNVERRDLYDLLKQKIRFGTPQEKIIHYLQMAKLVITSGDTELQEQFAKVRESYLNSPELVPFRGQIEVAEKIEYNPSANLNRSAFGEEPKPFLKALLDLYILNPRLVARAEKLFKEGIERHMENAKAIAPLLDAMRGLHALANNPKPNLNQVSKLVHQIARLEEEAPPEAAKEFANQISFIKNQLHALLQNNRYFDATPTERQIFSKLQDRTAPISKEEQLQLANLLKKHQLNILCKLPLPLEAEIQLMADIKLIQQQFARLPVLREKAQAEPDPLSSSLLNDVYDLQQVLSKEYPSVMPAVALVQELDQLGPAMAAHIKDRQLNPNVPMTTKQRREAEKLLRRLETLDTELNSLLSKNQPSPHLQAAAAKLANAKNLFEQFFKSELRPQASGGNVEEASVIPPPPATDITNATIPLNIIPPDPSASDTPISPVLNVTPPLHPYPGSMPGQSPSLEDLGLTQVSSPIHTPPENSLEV